MSKEQEITHLTEDEFFHLKPFLNEYTRNRKYRDLKNINTIVLHWTGSNNFDQAINSLRLKQIGYHFIIDNDGSSGKVGKVTQCISVNKRAAHAGKSYGPNGADVNQYSVGISFQTRGNNSAIANSETISEEAYQSLLKLIKELIVSLPNLKYITGHHWIKPANRIDPYTFNFNRLMGESFIKEQKMQLWKTGYYPFPGTTGFTGNIIAEEDADYKLEDCKCLEWEDLNNGDKRCKKSKGDCYVKRWGNNNQFSERTLAKAQGAFEASELSFAQDTSNLNS